MANFVMYEEYRKYFEMLPQAEQVKLLFLLFDFAHGNECKNIDKLKTPTKMAYLFMTNQIKRDIDKYARICERNRQNGQNGGAPVGNQNARKDKEEKQPKTTQNNPVQPKTTQNKPKNNNKNNNKENIIVVDNNTKEKQPVVFDNNNDNKNKNNYNNNFSKPTLKDIEDFCRERGNNLNAEKIFNYYNARGWVLGNGNVPVQDWRSVVLVWEQTEKEHRNSGQGIIHQQRYSQEEYDGLFDDFKNLKIKSDG